MDPQLLRFYNQELTHVREMGGEFAHAFPKIAARLGLDAFECADPYVERLLEGFAFMAARVQLKIDQQFPEFTQHLLEMVYPDYLAPTPSMAVVQVQPDLAASGFEAGYVLPRGTSLRSQLADTDSATPCEYRTAQAVTLFPIRLAEAEYVSSLSALAALDLPGRRGAKAAIRLRLQARGDLTLDKVALDRLPLFLRGANGLHVSLYEQLLAHAVGIVVRPAKRPAPWQAVLEPTAIRRVGFGEDEALLPCGPRAFQGYRLLREYFALPERFAFVEIAELGGAVRRCAQAEMDVIVLLDRVHPGLASALDVSSFNLFCTPAINLFPKRTDRIHLTEQRSEHHVVPDRTRPQDFEVYSVTGVTGLGANADIAQTFRPFYAFTDLVDRDGQRAYYTVRRVPRMLSARQRQQGARSSYVGSETYIALADGDRPPYRSDLRQLAIETLCTNRDLPLHMPVGKGATDFTLQVSAPVAATRCLVGPTRPMPSQVHGPMAWRLVSHLSLNYLSLADTDDRQGASALRELLGLYGNIADPAVRKQVEGVRSMASRPIIRRLPIPGPTVVGRGLEIAVTLDDAAFEGTGAFLLGSVLDDFFARYASINAFTETVVRTTDRGEIKRWPIRIGRRHTV